MRRGNKQNKEWQITENHKFLTSLLVPIIDGNRPNKRCQRHRSRWEEIRLSVLRLSHPMVCKGKNFSGLILSNFATEFFLFNFQTYSEAAFTHWRSAISWIINIIRNIDNQFLDIVVWFSITSDTTFCLWQTPCVVLSVSHQRHIYTNIQIQICLYTDIYANHWFICYVAYSNRFVSEDYFLNSYI